jgi:hypothetical protein
MVQGLVQARWQTGNSVGSGLVSVELQEWLRHVDKVRGIPRRSAGTWLEGWMVLWAGDSARGVVNEAGCGTAPGVCRSSQGKYPIGERLGRVRSTVRSGYSAREGTWGVWEPWTGVQGACHKLVCDNGGRPLTYSVGAVSNGVQES